MPAVPPVVPPTLPLLLSTAPVAAVPCVTAMLNSPLGLKMMSAALAATIATPPPVFASAVDVIVPALPTTGATSAR